MHSIHTWEELILASMNVWNCTQHGMVKKVAQGKAGSQGQFDDGIGFANGVVMP
jgi:hypothetical protein